VTEATSIVHITSLKRRDWFFWFLAIYECFVLNNDNNNNQDNVYGAVVIAEPLREFTRFIWW